MKKFIAAFALISLIAIPTLTQTANAAPVSGFGGGIGNHTGLLGSGILGSPAPQVPAFQNRIPAPLAAPSQPPVINGPSARSPYGGVL